MVTKLSMVGSSIRKRKADDEESPAKKLRTIADELDAQITARQKDQEERAQMKIELEEAQEKLKPALYAKNYWYKRFMSSDVKIDDLKEEIAALKKRLEKYEKAREIMNSDS